MISTNNKLRVNNENHEIATTNNVVVKKCFVKNGLWALGSLAFCIYYSTQFGRLFEICFDLAFQLYGFFLKGTTFMPIIEAIRWSPYRISGTIIAMLYLSVWHSEDIKVGNRKALILTTVLAIGITLFKTDSLVGKIYLLAVILHIVLELRKIGLGKAMAIFSWPVCPKQATRPYSAFVTFMMFAVLIILMAICSAIEMLGIRVISIFAVLFKMTILEQFSELYDRSYDAVYHHVI